MTPQMEDLIVKSQKSIAARGALVLVAAGSAMALTACGAGQISQTANQVPAVNGTNGNAELVSLRDASLSIGLDGETYVKFTAGNIEDGAQDVKLESIEVDGNDVALEGKGTIEPGCNLVTDTPDVIKDLKTAAKNTCNTYASPKLSDAKDIYPGGSKPAKFTFDTGVIEVNLPVVGEQPVSGEFHRDGSAQIVDKQEFHKDSHEGHSH